MGFDVNFNNNKPIIKSAQNTQDGGAGNLGYFKRENKEKNNDEQDISVFSEEETVDIFEPKEEKIEEEMQNDFSISKLIAQIILAIKDFFAKIFKTGK